MIEIRQVLHPYLLILHARTYFQQAPDNAAMPYLVYNFVNILDDGQGHQLLTLDIDGWDNADDTTPLEALMSQVEVGLDKHVLVGTGAVISVYLDNKIPLLEDDQKIHRRKYVFQGRIFKRG